MQAISLPNFKLSSKISKEIRLDLYKRMYTIRAFENKALELYAQNLIRGSIHCYIGEEAVAAGACAVLKPTDGITSTHRGHGHCIAKGGDLKTMMAELLGKKTGMCRGRGGSMHIADLDVGIYGANGIVGGGIAIATGLALAAVYNKTDQVILCFFGDGASSQGVLYESMNLASIWSLPVIYICENNVYAMTTRFSETVAGGSIAARAEAFGMPGEVIDGNVVEDVYLTVKKAVHRARGGGGPSFIEAQTYRWMGHWSGDPQVYRTQEEVEEWKKRCPLDCYKKILLALPEIDLKEIEKVEEEGEKAVRNALDFALGSPDPDPDSVLEDLYA